MDVYPNYIQSKHTKEAIGPLCPTLTTKLRMLVRMN